MNCIRMSPSERETFTEVLANLNRVDVGTFTFAELLEMAYDKGYSVTIMDGAIRVEKVS